AELLGVNTGRSLAAVLDTIRAVDYPAHLLLASGDLSQDYSPESYREFVAAVAPLGFPCHYLPGNHDDPWIMHLHMQGAHICAQQRILAGQWQILMLDSTVRGKPGGTMAPSQFDLIDQAITARPDCHTLLVMHHNPVLMNCAWLDQHCMDNGSEFLRRVAEYPQVKGLVWGHVHQSVDTVYEGPHGPLQLMATPSTCIQFKPLSPYFALDSLQPGYRLLELKADGSINTNVYRVPGNHFSPDNNSSGY
ncbi:MAG: 3',5'-cyclic-AMP phosphodiesterase, partial [Shewanella sp.]